MRDHSIFGEVLCGQPTFNPSVGPRSSQRTPCRGLFGTKLRADKCDELGIGPDELPRSLS